MAHNVSHADGATSTLPLAGKYLTFALSREQYGTPIVRVLEIFGLKPITHVPHSPEYLKGVINLRGRIIPIIDLRTKFGLPPLVPTPMTCIVVTQVAMNSMELAIGMVVDTVLEVRDFGDADLAPAPEYGSALNTRFVTAIGKRPGGEATILIDLDRIFSPEEAAALCRGSKSE